MAEATITPDIISKAIHAHLEAAVRSAMDQEIEKAKTALEKALRDQIGRISLSVMGQYAVERNGDDLIIRVKNEFTTKS